MRRALVALGVATAILAACHSNGPPGSTMDPMGNPMYRAAPAVGAETGSCPAAGTRSTSSPCRDAR